MLPSEILTEKLKLLEEELRLQKECIRLLKEQNVYLLKFNHSLSEALTLKLGPQVQSRRPRKS